MDQRPDPFKVYFTRTAGQARRAVSWGNAQPNALARFASVIIVLVLGLLLLVLLIPLLLVIALGLVLLSLYLRIKFWWARRSAQSEAQAGRENVKVIRRD